MEIQFSIISYFFMMIFYAIALGILSVLWRLVEPGRVGRVFMSSIAIFVIALPWIDEIWIAYHFHEACKDAGIHVSRQVDVDGFYYDAIRSGYSLINHYGYGFMEHKSRKAGKVDHITKTDGQWKKETIDKPTARYHLKYSYKHTPVNVQLTKFESVVLDSVTNEIIGRDTRYSRYPGWLNSLWMGSYGTGQTICKGPLGKELPKRKGRLHRYVLITTANG